MTTYKYSPSHIANYFLTKAQSEEEPITIMKLLKLVYIAYAWNYALREEKLFEEEIEAWRFGTVIPSLYQEFKYFEGKRIPKNNFSLHETYFSEGYEDDFAYPIVKDEDNTTLVILLSVWNTYKNYSTSKLSDLTQDIKLENMIETANKEIEKYLGDNT